MKNKKEKKVIFFDLDDTLMNSNRSQYNAIREFKKQYDAFKKIDDNEFANTWNKIVTEVYEKYHNGLISFEELKIKRIKDLFSAYGVNILDEEAKEIFKEYFKIYEKNWILFEDTMTILNKLKNKYKLAIITNGDGELQRKKINNIGIRDFFQEITISDEVGISKPDKRIFELTCKKMNVTPEECIMVGDKYNADIEGGISAGVTSILSLYFSSL